VTCPTEQQSTNVLQLTTANLMHFAAAPDEQRDDLAIPLRNHVLFALEIFEILGSEPHSFDVHTKIS
jgi:hypothetical protein